MFAAAEPTSCVGIGPPWERLGEIVPQGVISGHGQYSGMENADLFEAPPAAPRLMTLRQFASAQGMGYRTVVRAVRQGHIPSVRIAARRRVNFDAWLAKVNQPTEPNK